jgi:hypothetical protein
MTFCSLDKVFYIVFRDEYFNKKGMVLAPFWRKGVWTKKKECTNLVAVRPVLGLKS